MPKIDYKMMRPVEVSNYNNVARINCYLINKHIRYEKRGKKPVLYYLDGKFRRVSNG